jgi:glyoxylase-like metal-dependent hydrolase (beta-lactamase superfamily II)
MYRVYALGCGEKDTIRSQFLYRESSQERCIIAFYFWLVIGPSGPVVIDCAFNSEEADRRQIRDYRDRAQLLKACGVDADEVTQVFMTHLHYDHWAGYELFPSATFFIQRREVDFWRGDGCRFSLFRSSASVEAIEAIGPLERSGRVKIVEGDWWLADGLQAHLLGGHTPGLQALSIRGGDRQILIASDALHFYESLADRKPVQVTVNMQEALQAMERVIELAGAPADIVLPGHDTLVLTRFPSIAPGVVRVL